MDPATKLLVDNSLLSVAEALLKRWTCRHCGHETPVITEFCDGCGIEDCNQGKGEESPRDRGLRLAGKRRNAPPLWPKEKCISLARDITNSVAPDGDDKK